MLQISAVKVKTYAVHRVHVHHYVHDTHTAHDTCGGKLSNHDNVWSFNIICNNM